MKKTKLTRSLMAACSIVALSAVMYGCVHSGDDPVADMGEEMPMEPEQTPAEQLAAAQTAVEAAEAAVAAATNAAERAAAYGQLAAAEQMLAEAEVIPENVLAALRQRLADAEGDLDDAESLRTAIDAVNAAETAAGALDDDSDQAAVTAAMGLVTAAQTAVNALGADDQVRVQGQVDGANYMVMAAQTRLDTAAQVAADTKAAGTKTEAIAAVEATADAGLGGSAVTATGNDEGAYNLDIERDRDGTTVTVTVEGATDAADEDFEDAMAGLDGGRTMLTRTMDADDDGDVVTEVSIVATDIEPPKAVAFAMWEDDEGDTPHMLTVRQDGVPATVEMPNDSISVVEGDEDVNLPLIMSATFAVPPAGSSSATHTFLPADDDADPDTMGEQPRDAAMVDGTYRGADGTYTCAGMANCTVTVDDEGDVTAIDGTWIFTPDMGATSDQPDYDYLHYGFWLQKTADADGVLTYDEVQTFAGSSIDASIGGELDDVTGSASYEGGATGVYVHSVTNSDGTEASATSGQFSAVASLTAYFGQTVEDFSTVAIEFGAIAPNKLNTISGTIDKFVLENDEQQAWAVNLQGTRQTGQSTFSGSANGGGAAGTFSGTYHGETPTTESDTDGSTRVAPSTVVGEFGANFSNGSVAGAFGARKD